MSHKSETIDNFAAVVLAGGKGSRLNCTELPKVMMSVGNRPIVSYTIDTLEKIGLPIFLVIGYKGETIVDYFKERVQYAKQEQQLGTAHAAYTGMKKLPEEIQDVLVLNGDDSLFYKKESLIDFIQQHKDGGSTVSVLTTGIEKGDKSYGRVIKRDGKIYLVEKENLQEKDLDNTQTSTGTFCINKKIRFLFLSKSRIRCTEF